MNSPVSGGTTTKFSFVNQY